MVPLPDEPDPVTGRIVSIPDDGVPPLNALYLRAGRLPAPRDDEAVVLEQFATAHRLVAGDRAAGRDRTASCASCTIVGIAMSPEYVLAMSGRELRCPTSARSS